jgi:OmpA-OmpF porin, OOP family
MQISKRSSSISLAVLLAATGATAAQAGDTGWYVGANAGISDYSALINDSEKYAMTRFDNSDTAVGWSALGGYQFNDWLGLEVSYFDMGTASSSGDSFNLKYKLDGESMDVVISSSPLGWGVFGKAGLTAAHVDQTGRPIAGPLVERATDNGVIFDLGAGISYGMQNGWLFRLGLTQYHNPGSDGVNNTTITGRGNVNLIYLGAIYRF